jgi:hypothetical protein
MNLEVVIGITGHRDIPSSTKEQLNNDFKALVQGLLGQYQNLNVRVLTGLATGADRIAANVILDLNNPRLTCTGVLPLELSEYINDFTEVETSELEELVRNFKAKDFKIIELNVNKTRPECYQDLGSYLLNKSDLLVSFWDLKGVDSLGGTYDVTRQAFKNDQQISANSFYDNSSIPVYVVPCQRESNEPLVTMPSPGYLENIAEQKLSNKTPKKLVHTLTQLDELQDEITTSSFNEATAYRPTENNILGSSEDSQRLIKNFERFDYLANNTQKKVNSIHKLLAILTLMIAGTFLVYAKLVPQQFILGGYLGLFLIGVIWFKVVNPNKVKAKYALLRLISESLRIEFFLREANTIDGLGKHSHSQILNTGTAGSGQTIRAIIKQSTILGGKTNRQSNSKEALLDWFTNQLAYFRKSYHRLHLEHEKTESLVNASIYIPIIILAIVLFPLSYYSLKSIYILGISGKIWAVFFSALIPVVGLVYEQLAINKSIKEQMEFANQHIKFLEGAIEAVQNAEKQDALNKIASLAAEELSKEHVLWLTMTNMKTLTTAHGG